MCPYKNCQFTLVQILIWRKQTIGVGQLKNYSCLQIHAHFQTRLKPIPYLSPREKCPRSSTSAMVCKMMKRLWPHVTARQVRAIKKLWKELTYPAGFACFCLFVCCFVWGVLFVCFFACLNNMKSPFGFIYAYVCEEVSCFFRFIRNWRVKK